MLGYVKSLYESLMGIGTIFQGVLAVANLCVGNVPGAFTEGVAAVKSYAGFFLLLLSRSKRLLVTQ